MGSLCFTPPGKTKLRLVDQPGGMLVRRTDQQTDSAWRVWQCKGSGNSPFVWTKTADQILASIARFAQCTRAAHSPGLIARTMGQETSVSEIPNTLAQGGADPGSAADALVGLSISAGQPDQGSSADGGVRPTYWSVRVTHYTSCFRDTSRGRKCQAAHYRQGTSRRDRDRRKLRADRCPTANRRRNRGRPATR